MVSNGTPSSWIEVSAVKKSGNPVIGLPLVMNSAMPEQADMVARVATKGWMRA